MIATLARIPASVQSRVTSFVSYILNMLVVNYSNLQLCRLLLLLLLLLLLPATAAVVDTAGDVEVLRRCSRFYVFACRADELNGTSGQNERGRFA